jgi:serine/threonine protein phosphatase 1
MNFIPPQGLRLVRRLPANAAGRDFVVGDLHGCFHALAQLLDRCDFDPGRDRLLAVGDLADRGRRSLECLGLLECPWFFSVMGNHEELLLDYFAPWLAEAEPPEPFGEAGLAFLGNGGGWVLAASDGNFCPDERLGGLLAKVRDLPQILVVGEGAGRYHLVHAELVQPGFGGPLQVWDDARVDALPEFGRPGEDHPCLRWSRELMGSGEPVPVRANGLSPTFCGHTIGLRVRRRLSHVCLDTGGFADRPGDTSGRFGLTIAEVGTGRWITLRGGEFFEGRFAGIPPK